MEYVRKEVSIMLYTIQLSGGLSYINPFNSTFYLNYIYIYIYMRPTYLCIQKMEI
jgi:hypothetical protein